MMTKIGSETMNEEFQKNGYAIFKNLIPKKIINKIIDSYRLMLSTFIPNSDGLDIYELITLAEKTDHGIVYKCSKTIASSIVINEMVSAMELAKIANTVKGWSEDRLHTNLFQTPIQFPNDDRFDFQWHQENGSYDTLTDLLTFWFPVLHKCTGETGSVQLIPGSHRSGVLPSKHIVKDSGLNDWIVEISKEQEKEAFVVEIEPGDVICFDANIIHRSTLNQSDRPRMTGIIRVGDITKMEKIAPLALPCNYNTQNEV